MNEIIQKQDQELKDIIYKVPALITLYVASQVAEGHLVPAEEKSAKIYLSILCHQANETLQDYFKKVKESFDENIELLDKELPKNPEERRKALFLKMLYSLYHTQEITDKIRWKVLFFLLFRMN